ncbi:hypothetical protein [Winogradskyella sp.]|uniref:hypothetical protein n=1 Tax=Winogradskyella sp. TaxID=1883156 RepID=UPI0035133719
MSSQIIKLYYISPRDVRKSRADAVHIMYSCAGFANNGIDVELITPKVKRNNYHVDYKDIFGLYDVPQNFKLTELNTKIKEVDNKSSSLVMVFNRLLFSFIYILRNLSGFRTSDVVIYSKCYTSIIPYILFKSVGLIKCKLVFETPFLKNNIYHRFIMKRMDAVVTMTKYVENILLNTFDIPKAKVILCPIRFQTDYKDTTIIDKVNTRKGLGWDEKIKYVVYAGKTGQNLKRIKIFANASNEFTNTKFVIVGATQGLKEKYGGRDFKNLILYPFQSYPNYLKFVNAADVLVATYENTLYNRHTLSPGKGGAYLQSENPVIFTDFPCLRERFPNHLVSFVRPDDTEDLVSKVKEVLDGFDTFRVRAKKAAKFVEDKTFTKASLQIINRLNTILFEQK